VPGAQSYRLYRAGGPSSTAPPVQVGGALTATNYSDTLPAPGSYQYQVTAVRDGVESILSAPATVSMPVSCYTVEPPPIGTAGDLVLTITMVQTDVVYHGLFGHFFLQDIPHVLKVRIVWNLEARVADEVKREGISADKAREVILRDDEERRKWALYLYGADFWDATLYDLVIHLKTITVDDAVSLICHVLELPGFQTTAQSQEAIDSLVEAARMEMTPVWWEGSTKKE
jgi:cytidylate kinase